MRPTLAVVLGSLLVVGAAALAFGQELPRPRAWKLNALERHALNDLAARRAELDKLEQAHAADLTEVLATIKGRLELPAGDLRRLDEETVTVVQREVAALPAAVAAPSTSSPASQSSP